MSTNFIDLYKLVDKKLLIPALGSRGSALNSWGIRTITRAGK
ncbi:hypothetical protein [Neobacillus cucumis]|nr:hypothetical protein [Neobacillus cucumis]